MQSPGLLSLGSLRYQSAAHILEQPLCVISNSISSIIG